MKTEWQIELLSRQPEKFEQVNDTTWIERRNITKKSDTIYECESRFVSGDLKMQIELISDVVSETNHSEVYKQGYEASKILLNEENAEHMLSRATALRPIIELATQNLDDDTAVSAPELFPSWKANEHYAKDYKVSRNINLYKCLQEHTSQNDWVPEETPSLWVLLDNPSEEWPEWRQPQGAHDAYNKGYKVSYHDKHWISNIDANVWEPGVYGWTEQ